MTITLSCSRPEDLLRCGAVLGRVAEQVAVASGRAHRATALPWHGQAGSAYDLQLSSVAHRLNALERAYDEACDLLVGYSRELAVARELAVHADALDEQADRERVSDVLVGALVPGLADSAAVHSQRASQLRDEAVEVEGRAARRAAEILEQLVDEAPRSTEGGSALRMAAGAARGFTNSVVGGIVGIGAMAGDALLGLPFVGSRDSQQDHRDDLVGQAKAFAQPWLAVERLLQQWQQHHESEAVGELGGMLLMRKTHAGSKEGARFGFLDAMHEPVLRAVYRGSRAEVALDEQWLLHRAQARWDADIERLRHLPPATLEQLLEGQVDLVHAEALGGHAIRKHVGRDWAFLRERSLTDTKFGDSPRPMSSFRDLAEAERAVAEAVAANVSVLRGFRTSTSLQVRVSAPLGSAVGRLLVAKKPVTVARYAMVECRRSPNGSPYVHTAFVSAKPAIGRSRG